MAPNDGFKVRPEDSERWARGVELEGQGKHLEAAEAIGESGESYTGESRAHWMLACARNLIRGSAVDRSWRPMAEAAKAAGSYRLLRSLDRLLQEAVKVSGQAPAKRRMRIALLGTVTMDFWVPALRALAFGWGMDATFYLGPFGQYQQEILDPGSKLATFRPDIVVLLVDRRALGLEAETADPDSVIESQIGGLRGLWKECRERLGAFVIQANFEIPVEDPFGRLSASLAGGAGRLLRRLNLALWEAEQAEPGVAIYDLEQTAANYGKWRWQDAVLWQAAKQYPAMDAIPWVARDLTALFRAVTGLTSKCLVLDLDGTLWGGVIGEDGLSGIQLGGTPAGESYKSFQKHVKALTRRGILLAVCSKNNEEDAKAPFLEHPEMVLRLNDISAFVANWKAKDENLRVIARMLNIGLDSLVMVDDNPAERGRIRQNVPEVQVVDLPADPAGFIAALDAPRYFEALTLTEEDRKRVASMSGNAERRELEASASGNVEAYLAGLGMKVKLMPFDEANLPRIAQLINKTNQFNLTTRRRTESEVRALIGRPDCYTSALRVEDRFGDSGLTGVLIAFDKDGFMEVDTWLMSCRVLGRKLDEVMWNALVENARQRGAKRIRAAYWKTAKNGLVEDLYPQMGMKLESEEDGGKIFCGDPVEISRGIPSYIQVYDKTNQQERRFTPIDRE